MQIKMIGSGQISAGGGSVELPGASGVSNGKAQIVKSMRIVNKHATDPVTLNIYVNSGGDPTEKLVSPQNLSLAAGQMYVDDSEIVLEATHKLKVAVTTGTGVGPVHYVISGIERDAS